MIIFTVMKMEILQRFFAPGNCPYSAIAGWANPDTFNSFNSDNCLVKYNLTTKKEEVLIKNSGYDFSTWWENQLVLPITERYILTFATLPWHKQNFCWNPGYMYLFDLETGSRVLTDELLNDDAQFSYELFTS